MDVTKSIFEGLDWFVLGLYFAILVGVAVWVALQRNKNTEDYFLAGRNVGWFVIFTFLHQKWSLYYARILRKKI